MDEDEKEIQALLDDVTALFNNIAHSDTLDAEKFETLLAGLDLIADHFEDMPPVQAASAARRH